MIVWNIRIIAKSGSTYGSILISEEARWYVSGGTLSRKMVEHDIDLSSGTNSIGVVTLTKKKYTNFELTVDYKMGDLTYYWPVIGFRQTEPGKYYLSDGAGAFVQNGGKATLWGTDGVGGPYESAGYASYQNGQWHTLKVVLDGLNFKMYIDNKSEPELSRVLPETMFRSGYISLISVNNNCSFRNLSIKELPIVDVRSSYSQEPTLDTFSEASLLRQAKTVENINELSVAPIKNEEIKTKFFDSAVPLIIFGSVFAIEIILFVLMLLLKKKKVN